MFPVLHLFGIVYCKGICFCCDGQIDLNKRYLHGISVDQPAFRSNFGMIWQNSKGEKRGLDGKYDTIKERSEIINECLATRCASTVNTVHYMTFLPRNYLFIGAKLTVG